MHKVLGSTLVIAVLAFWGAAHPAQAQTFDFESSTATFISPPQNSRPGALTSLAITNGGLTFTLFRQNNERFDIVENTGNQAGKPNSYGVNSVDPFFAPGTNGFIANFSSPLQSISLDFGDYGDDADTLTLNAFSGPNGTGTLLATANGSLPANNNFAFTTSTIGVAANGIQSITLNGTSSFGTIFTNSVFFDNFRASLVPEPGSVAMLAGLGVTGVLFAIRRLRRRVK